MIKKLTTLFFFLLLLVSAFASCGVLSTNTQDQTNTDNQDLPSHSLIGTWILGSRTADGETMTSDHLYWEDYPVDVIVLKVDSTGTQKRSGIGLTDSITYWHTDSNYLVFTIQNMSEDQSLEFLLLTHDLILTYPAFPGDSIYPPGPVLRYQYYKL